MQGMEWTSPFDEEFSGAEPTCPICDKILRPLCNDAFSMLRCDKCELSFRSPQADAMEAWADELNAADAEEVGRCRVCGCAEYDACFKERYWVPDPLGAWLCNRCA